MYPAQFLEQTHNLVFNSIVNMKVKTLCDNCKREFEIEEDKADDNDVLCNQCQEDLNI